MQTFIQSMMTTELQVGMAHIGSTTASTVKAALLTHLARFAQT